MCDREKAREGEKRNKKNGGKKEEKGHKVHKCNQNERGEGSGGGRGGVGRERRGWREREGKGKGKKKEVGEKRRKEGGEKGQRHNKCVSLPSSAAPARRYGGSWSNTASLRRVRRPGRAMLQTSPRCRPLRNRSRYAHSARCEAAQGQARSPATSPAGAAPAGLRPLPWAAVPARPRAPPGTPARVLRPGPARPSAAPRPRPAARPCLPARPELTRTEPLAALVCGFCCFLQRCGTGNVGTLVGPTPLRLMGSKGCLAFPAPNDRAPSGAGGRVPGGAGRAPGGCSSLAERGAGGTGASAAALRCPRAAWCCMWAWKSSVREHGTTEERVGGKGSRYGWEAVHETCSGEE